MSPTNTVTSRNRPAVASLCCLGVGTSLLLVCSLALRSFASDDAVGRAWSAGAVGLLVGGALAFALAVSVVGVVLGLLGRRSTAGVVGLAGNGLAFLAAGALMVFALPSGGGL